MKKVLLTGGTGFVGKNILPILRQSFEVMAPSRQELDMLDEAAVKDYLQEQHFDVVLHSANPNPVKNPKDDGRIPMLEGSLRAFMNLYQQRHLYGKMLYIGSGAEYDKRQDVVLGKEEEAVRSIPQDDYGFAKYIANVLASQSGNVYNMRLFACYGPYDHESKFITHVIHCCLRQEAVTIRQDCYFDYLHVFDLGRMLSIMIREPQKYKEYNMCSGQRASLREIAETVCGLMDYDPQKIVFGKTGWNKEYTGSNQRFLNEYGPFAFTSLKDGIRQQIAWEKEHWL